MSNIEGQSFILKLRRGDVADYVYNQLNEKEVVVTGPTGDPEFPLFVKVLGMSGPFMAKRSELVPLHDMEGVEYIDA